MRSQADQLDEQMRRMKSAARIFAGLEAIERIGYGLHHICYHSDALDKDIASFLASGYELVQEFVVAGTFRIVYLGLPQVIGSYVEVIHMTPEVSLMMSGWQQAAANWDGIHRISYLDHGQVTQS